MNGKTMIKGAAIVAVALLCASASRVYAAASVSLGADDMVYFGLANGLALPTGDAVYMGQFANPAVVTSLVNANGTISNANYATLVSDFVPLSAVSESLIGAGTAGSPGSMSASYSGTNVAFATGPIYLLVVAGPSTAAPGGQVGVFTGDATWTYPADMQTGGATIDLDQVNTTPLLGSYTAAQNAVINGYTWDATGGGGYGTIASVDLAPIVSAIPEPSSITLVVLGLFGATGMIRRRRQS